MLVCTVVPLPIASGIKRFLGRPYSSLGILRLYASVDSHTRRVASQYGFVLRPCGLGRERSYILSGDQSRNRYPQGIFAGGQRNEGPDLSMNRGHFAAGTPLTIFTTLSILQHVIVTCQLSRIAPRSIELIVQTRYVGLLRPDTFLRHLIGTLRIGRGPLRHNSQM